MSLRKPMLNLLIAVFAMLSLSGCVTSLSVDTQAQLQQLTITTDDGRTEQLFRQEIERLIGDQSGARYDLSASITSSRGDNSMTMTVRYSLYDQEIGEILINKSVSSSASIGGVSSEFGEEQAFLHAEERLSINLAQKVYQRLLLYFTRAASSS
jgi:hypothetical protein